MWEKDSATVLLRIGDISGMQAMLRAKIVTFAFRFRQNYGAFYYYMVMYYYSDRQRTSV